MIEMTVERFKGLVCLLCIVGVGLPLTGAGAAANSTPQEAIQSFMDAMESGDVATAESLVDQRDVVGQKASVMIEELVDVAQSVDAFREAATEKFGQEALLKAFQGQGLTSMGMASLYQEQIQVEVDGDTAGATVEGSPQEIRLVNTDDGWKVDLMSAFGLTGIEGLEMEKVVGKLVKVFQVLAKSFEGLEELVAKHDNVEDLKQAFVKKITQGMASSIGGMLGGGMGSQNLLPNQTHLLNGDVIKGEIVNINEKGIVIKPATGGTFSERIHWSELSQKTLKELSAHPVAEQYTFPYIEIPPDKTNSQNNITVSEVDRIERPVKEGSLFGTLGTPVGLFLLATLFIANVFAGYAIANYRDHPAALAGAISAVFPVLGPLIFLSLPARSFQSMEEGIPAEMEPEVDHMEGSEAEVPPEHAAEAGPASEPAQKTGGLSIHQSQQRSSQAGGVEPRRFTHDDTTFDRQFFEVNFPSFFRVVRTGPDKDMVLAVQTPKSEYVGKRISRISAKELHLQLQQGAKEVRVPFDEITQVEMRHKDSSK